MYFVCVPSSVRTPCIHFQCHVGHYDNGCYRLFPVLPNRLTVPLVANLHVAQLRSPLPRVTLHCALMEYLTILTALFELFMIH